MRQLPCPARAAVQSCSANWQIHLHPGRLATPDLWVRHNGGHLSGRWPHLEVIQCLSVQRNLILESSAVFKHCCEHLTAAVSSIKMEGMLVQGEENADFWRIHLQFVY